MTTMFKTDLANYDESIQNIIYLTSKYIKQLHIVTPSDISELENSNYDIDVISFLICEGEEILRNKMLRMTADASTVLKLKYEKICEKITDIKDNSVEFLVSQEFNDYIKTELKKIRSYELFDLNYDDLKITNTLPEELYNLDSFLEEEKGKVYNNEFNCDGETLNKLQLIDYLNEVESYIDDTIVYLKHAIEQTNKKKTTVILFRFMITCMVLSHRVLSLIKIK